MVKTKNDIAFEILVLFIITLVGVVCLLPILYVISYSLTPMEEMLRNGGFSLIPHSITFSAYKQMIKDPTLINALKVSAFITVVGTTANLIVTLMLAYPLSRHSMPLSGAMMKIVMFCMLFDAGIVPTYLVVRKTGLINTLWAMIVPTLVSAYNLVIMKAFFEGLPEELFEAARIDGANEFRILWHLILPMALPIILTIGMYYAVDHWNCYLLSIYYITRDQLKPLQVILRRLLDASRNAADQELVPTETLKMAAVCYATAPIIVVYPFIQKYFVKGTLAGAVKG